jgi:hypothetical protein
MLSGIALHLRLSDHIAIQRHWVVRLRQTVIHVIEKINARGARGGAVIIAAGIVA